MAEGIAEANSDEDAIDVEVLVGDMNHAAGKEQRTAPNKASKSVATPQMQQVSGDPVRRSPRKRKSVEIAGEDGGPAKQSRRSTGLQRRRSTPILRPSGLRRGDLYELHHDDGDNEQPAEKPTRKPATSTKEQRMRNLRKRVDNPSPFKDKGEVEIPVASNVNLGDSPTKRPTGRPKKVALQSQRDVPQAAVPESSRSLRTTPGVRNKRTTGQSGDANMDSEDEGTSDYSDSSDEEPPQQKRVAPDSRAVASDREMPEAKIARATERRQQSQLSEKQIKAREATEAQYRKMARNLEGLEQVTQIYGGGEAWCQVLAGCSALARHKVASSPESSAGQHLVRRIRRFRARIKDNTITSTDRSGDADLIPIEHIDLITKEVRALQIRTGASREMPCRGRDLYGHIVPWLGKALKAYLHATQVDEAIPPRKFGELHRLLEATNQAAQLACVWDPRPSMLASGTLSRMRNVRQHLGILRQTFNRLAQRSQETVDDQVIRDRYYRSSQRSKPSQDEKRLRLEAIRDTRRQFPSTQSDQQSQDVPLQNMQNAVLPVIDQLVVAQPVVIEPIEVDRPRGMSREEYLYRYHQQGDSRSQQRARQERLARIRRSAPFCPTNLSTQPLDGEIFDVDDFNVEQSLPARPKFHRAQTEEIPAPTQPPWTDGETEALVNALRKDLSDIRFQNILDRFGGPGSVLERHDLDSLMSQARFIKQSVGSKLAMQGFDDRWLRLVPG